MTGVTAPLSGLAFRRATVEDAASLAAVLVEGFETYRAFAPHGWRLPEAEDVAAELAARLDKPTVWCLLAEDGERVAGYVSLLPAADARRPSGEPGLAHLWMLFVRTAWWGSGLAGRLHEACCDAALTRGFTAMRLYTPAAQARARRFYERERWTLADGPVQDEEIGFAVVEYRRELMRRAPGGVAPPTPLA